MKQLIVWLSVCSVYIYGSHIFVHNDTCIKTNNKSALIVHYTRTLTNPCDLSCIPQQLLIIKGPKKVSIAPYMPHNTYRYIKCLLGKEQKDGAEFLIKKEHITKEMCNLVKKTHHITSPAKQTVFCVYHKDQNQHWEPLVTIPESQISDINIYPDGTLHL